MVEKYECRNCFHSGALNVHGGCERCGSQAVISQAMLQGDTVYAVGAAGYWLAMAPGAGIIGKAQKETVNHG